MRKERDRVKKSSKRRKREALKMIVWEKVVSAVADWYTSDLYCLLGDREHVPLPHCTISLKFTPWITISLSSSLREILSPSLYNPSPSTYYKDAFQQVVAAVSGSRITEFGTKMTGDYKDRGSEVRERKEETVPGPSLYLSFS